MDSEPPAMIRSAPPERIFSAAMAMACNPEEQKAVNGDAGDGVRETGAKRCHAGHVHARFGFGSGAAEDDIVDFGFIYLGMALEKLVKDGGGHVVGTGIFERSASGFSDWGAEAIDDYCFLHVSPSVCALLTVIDASRLTAPAGRGSERDRMGEECGG